MAGGFPWVNPITERNSDSLDVGRRVDMFIDYLQTDTQE